MKPGRHIAALSCHESISYSYANASKDGIRADDAENSSTPASLHVPISAGGPRLAVSWRTGWN